MTRYYCGFEKCEGYSGYEDDEGPFGGWLCGEHIEKLFAVYKAAIDQGCTCPMRQDDPRINGHTSNCLKTVLQKLKVF